MIGVANTIARIGAGFLADLPCVDPLVLNVGALFLGNLAIRLCAYQFKLFNSLGEILTFD